MKFDEWLIAVDPGVYECAVAWFQDQVLVRVEARVTPLHAAATPMRVVCEIPQVYDPRKAEQHRAPKDIVNLALAAGRMTGAYKCEYFLPAEWKGQLPCTCSAKIAPAACIHHRRMIASLSTAELVRLGQYEHVTHAGVRHNGYDAVSLGLVVLGRLTPGPIHGKLLCQPGS